MSARNKAEFDPGSVASFLRRTHPHKTAEHVAERIAAPVETVRQWLRGVAKPNFCATLALVCAYGPELLAAALPALPEWAARALNEERRRVAMTELLRLQAELGALDHEGLLEGAPASRLGGVVDGRLSVGAGGGGGFGRAGAGDGGM